VSIKTSPPDIAQWSIWQKSVNRSKKLIGALYQPEGRCFLTHAWSLKFGITGFAVDTLLMQQADVALAVFATVSVPPAVICKSVCF
jgi:hypothetical protein